MKNFDSVQVEQLKDISQYLHKERQARSISLEEVAVKTYIPLRLLQALESEQLERLPEPVFVQGFIRRYADALGLDGQTIAKKFSAQPTPQVAAQLPESKDAVAVSQPTEETAGPVATAPLADEKPSISQSSFQPVGPLNSRSSRSTRISPLLGIVGGAAILLLGIVAIRTFSSERSPSTAQPTAGSMNPASSPPSSSAPPQAQPTSAQSAAQPPAPTSNSPIQVAVNLVGESWLQVDIDGKTEFEGILKKGEQKTWTAQKKLVLQSGNAGAVSVSYNRGEAKLMGGPGEVKDAIFPPAPVNPAPTN